MIHQGVTPRCLPPDLTNCVFCKAPFETDLAQHLTDPVVIASHLTNLAIDASDCQVPNLQSYLFQLYSPSFLVSTDCVVALRGDFVTLAQEGLQDCRTLISRGKYLEKLHHDWELNPNHGDDRQYEIIHFPTYPYRVKPIK